ncbi:unnamed protein product [Effrenium voratum]|nr:unnamed protein product [Effrenium voratum]
MGLSPIPSWVNNYALPLADVPLKIYLPATLLGMLPPLAANVYTGSCAASLAAVLDGSGGASSVDFWGLALGAASALSGAELSGQFRNRSLGSMNADVFAFCRPEGAIAGAAIVQQMASAAMDDVPVVSSGDDGLEVELEGTPVKLGLCRAAGGLVVAEKASARRSERWGIASADGWVLGMPGPGPEWRPHPGVMLQLEDLAASTLALGCPDTGDHPQSGARGMATLRASKSGSLAEKGPFGRLAKTKTCVCAASASLGRERSRLLKLEQRCLQRTLRIVEKEEAVEDLENEVEARERELAEKRDAFLLEEQQVAQNLEALQKSTREAQQLQALWRPALYLKGTLV